MKAELDVLGAAIAGCRICVETPVSAPLPHAPRPVCVLSNTARIAICGQAPGTRVHASGRPFTDASGDRLRQWLGVDDATFYDCSKFAIVPMGFCFPGLDAKGGDLPPRRECAAAWHERVFAAMPQIDLVICIGQYAQAWHLGKRRGKTLTETVRRWRDHIDAPKGPAIIPLPHPSWRNTAWLRKHPWFDDEVVPELRRLVAARLG